MFPSPTFDGADDEHLADVAASLPSGGRIVFGPEWKAGLADRHNVRQRVALGVDHAGAHLVGELPSAAIQPIPICLWTCRAEMPLEWVAIR